MLRWPLYTRTSRPMTPKGTWTSKKAIKASSTRIWILLKTDIFFSILAFRPLLIKGVFRTPSSPPPLRQKKIELSENGHQSEFFWKRRQYRFRVKGQKRRFSNAMMSYIIQRMPCEGFYPISIFLAFWCGREKAIQVSQATCGLVFYWKLGEKIFCVEKYGDTCARVASHAEFVTRSCTTRDEPLRTSTWEASAREA